MLAAPRATIANRRPCSCVTPHAVQFNVQVSQLDSEDDGDRWGPVRFDFDDERSGVSFEEEGEEEGSGHLSPRSAQSYADQNPGAGAGLSPGSAQSPLSGGGGGGGASRRLVSPRHRPDQQGMDLTAAVAAAEGVSTQVLQKIEGYADKVCGVGHRGCEGVSHTVRTAWLH
jgi:hypothetical protein